VTVALVQPSPVDLGEPAQPLGLQQLHRAMQLGELLLDAGVGELGEGLGPQALDRRSELAHAGPGSDGSIVQNMCSSMRPGSCPRL
jgi:hypothetical protein